VVLVDDHKLIRLGIRRLLEGIPNIKVVGEAGSGEEATQVVRQNQPDVVLLDIKMPGLSGLDTIQKLLRINPELKIIILTAYENDVFPIHMMDAGASGYLTKGASQEEVVKAVQIVHSGQRHLSPEIAKLLALKKIVGANKSPLEILSNRELQIAMMVTRGVKVKEIAEKLHLNPKTVNSYRYRIFNKLGIKGDVELTHLVLHHGLLDSDVKSDK
jgi:two-component system invasion response regulator UvrY